MFAAIARTVGLAFALMAALFAVCPWGSAGAEVLKANNVFTDVTVTLPNPLPVTSPAQIFYVKSIIVSNPNITAAACATILRSNVAVTDCIGVPEGNSVQIKFDPPILFAAAETVQVRNGSFAGPLHFTVIGVRDVR